MTQYHNKIFRLVHNSSNGALDGDMRFHYRQQGQVIWSEYKSESILKGHLIGIVADNGIINMRYHQVTHSHEIMTGTCRSVPEILPNGKIRLHEKWQWTSGDQTSGASTLEEI
ncbi:n-acetylglutamate synthase [Cyclobacterium roseum]|uniref:n-acetylglutamate synthase n=1 Tax=Cyclobacterium roseum TaxID=2666137 RepID=UPI001391744E|nr:n-acetylglutamate synthase [Cyclobacterium roseum]